VFSTWGNWEDGFNAMKYSGGQGCWNGPARSALVSSITALIHNCFLCIAFFALDAFIRKKYVLSANTLGVTEVINCRVITNFLQKSGKSSTFKE